MSSQHESAQTNEPSRSKADYQNIFETSFAMQAMQNSLLASPLSAVASFLAPATHSPALQNPQINLIPSQSHPDCDVYDLHDPGSSSFALPKTDSRELRDGDASPGFCSSVASQRKGSYSPTLPSIDTAGATSSVGESGDFLTSSPARFTSVDIARSPLSLQLPLSSRAKVSFPYPDVTRETDKPQSLMTYHSSSSKPELDPYGHVSVLGRRIISVIVDAERYASIHRTTKAAAEYEGVNVSVIMEQLMSLDDSESITPYAVE